MKKYFTKKLVFFSLIIFFFLFLSAFSFAQTLSLSISPPLLEVVIKPGKSILIAYNVENSGDPVVLTPQVLSFEPSDERGNIKLKEIEGPLRFSLDNSEIELGKPFLLKSKSSQQLLLRIRVPENAPEGDYYYSLALTSSPNLPQEKNVSTATQATIASNILITITESGVLDIKPKIVFFDVIPKIQLPFLGKIKLFDSFEKIPVVLKIANTGKNFMKAQGEITLEGVLGTKIKWDLVPSNILAQSERLIFASSEAEIKPFFYNKKPVSLILPKGFYLGKYTLRAKVNFGEESPTILNASTSFFAFPIKLTLILLILSIGGYLLNKLLISNRRG